MTPEPRSQDLSNYQGLIYSVLQNSPAVSANQGFTAALVAAHPRAGTSHVTAMLAETLEQGVAGSVLPLDGRHLANLRAAPDVALGQANRNMRLRVTDSSQALIQGTWRGSIEYRAAFLAQLRERYQYVLIDCPSLKESNEILGLAQLVDGVLLVVEANRTRKNQIAYLERTIESAGGKIRGHLLNKRTYPIPGPVYDKLESWGA